MLLEGIIFFLVLFNLVALLLTLICRDSSNFNGIDPIKDQSWLYAYFTRFYFGMTTLTTIGYGDITAATVKARLLVMAIMFFIIVIILKSLDNVRVGLGKYLTPNIPKVQLTKNTESTKQAQHFANMTPT